jgi:Protein of unknown function (DUF4058)
MPTPFPGMDPYLEQASLWANVHNSLIIALRDELAPRLRPRYYVAVEERTVHMAPEDLSFAARPDVAVVERGPGSTTAVAVPSGSDVLTVDVPMLDDLHETFLEIHEIGSANVVTIVEILSPTNKIAGEGRRQYLQKRLNVFSSLTSMVEIDLLRAGEPMPVYGFAGHSDYRILVSRGQRRPRAELRPFGLRQPIPAFRLPLQPGDHEPEVALTPLLHALYDRAGYDLRIDYRRDPAPPLTADDLAWAEALLRAAGLR